MDASKSTWKACEFMRGNSLYPNLALLSAGLWAGLVLAGAPARASADQLAPGAEAGGSGSSSLVMAESVLNQEPKPRPLRMYGEEPAPAAGKAVKAGRKTKPAVPVRASQPAKTKAPAGRVSKSAKQPAGKPAAKGGAKAKKTKRVKKVKR